MSDVVVHCEGLGKRYRIGEAEPYWMLRETLADAVSGAARLVRARLRGCRTPGVARRATPLWALRDVSFEVRQGEVVGVIGPNGAGKSTLLKILARITKPTEGRVAIRRRVGSLLEVGAGFHPELTGRDNIYLNGAVLGMRKAEIARKFDEIVAFAEMDRFLDTPVKRYSTGMYTRLGFAIAAHLDAEILVVDEALAVGDVAFQTKCLTKMNDVTAGGRTVIFVSHQLNHIRQLCKRSIWLDDGRVRQAGVTRDVVAAYESHTRWSAAEAARTSDRGGYFFNGDCDGSHVTRVEGL